MNLIHISCVLRICTFELRKEECKKKQYVKSKLYILKYKLLQNIQLSDINIYSKYDTPSKKHINNNTNDIYISQQRE